MDYRKQTLKLIDIIKKKKSLNVMKHFFAQLSTVEELDVFPIVNAISDSSLDYSLVLNNSIKKESWITTISLINVRNIIVFLLWKENKLIIDQSENYLLDIKCKKYNDLKDKKGSIQTDKLVHLIRTCFYIKQINIIKSDTFSLDDTWDCFHPFLKKYYLKYGLAKLIYFCFNLIEPLLI